MMKISPRDILSMKGPIEIARAVFYGKIIANHYFCIFVFLFFGILVFFVFGMI